MSALIVASIIDYKKRVNLYLQKNIVDKYNVQIIQNNKPSIHQ